MSSFWEACPQEDQRHHLFPSHPFELMPSGRRFTAVNRELKEQATLWFPQQLWSWILRTDRKWFWSHFTHNYSFVSISITVLKCTVHLWLLMQSFRSFNAFNYGIPFYISCYKSKWLDLSGTNHSIFLLRAKSLEIIGFQCHQGHVTLSKPRLHFPETNDYLAAYELIPSSDSGRYIWTWKAELWSEIFQFLDWFEFMSTCVNASLTVAAQGANTKTSPMTCRHLTF